jgi:hypothetical protein
LLSFFSFFFFFKMAELYLDVVSRILDFCTLREVISHATISRVWMQAAMTHRGRHYFHIKHSYANPRENHAARRRPHRLLGWMMRSRFRVAIASLRIDTELTAQMSYGILKQMAHLTELNVILPHWEKDVKFGQNIEELHIVLSGGSSDLLVSLPHMPRLVRLHVLGRYFQHVLTPLVHCRALRSLFVSTNSDHASDTFDALRTCNQLEELHIAAYTCRAPAVDHLFAQGHLLQHVKCSIDYVFDACFGYDPDNFDQTLLLLAPYLTELKHSSLHRVDMSLLPRLKSLSILLRAYTFCIPILPRGCHSQLETLKLDLTYLNTPHANDDQLTSLLQTTPSLHTLHLYGIHSASFRSLAFLLVARKHLMHLWLGGYSLSMESLSRLPIDEMKHIYALRALQTLQIHLLFYADLPQTDRIGLALLPQLCAFTYTN